MDGSGEIGWMDGRIVKQRERDMLNASEIDERERRRTRITTQ